MRDLSELFNLIETSSSIAELYELDCIPNSSYTGEYFFISYSHGDYKLVYKDIFAYELEGLTVWFDRGMKPGSDWLENAEHFISQFACKGIIIYLSNLSLNSRAVFEEIRLSNIFHKPLIPILMDDTTLIDNDIGKTIITNLSLNEEEANIVSVAFTERTLWLSSNSPIKSKINYIQNLKDESEVYDVIELNWDNSKLILDSATSKSGLYLKSVNDIYMIRALLPINIEYIGQAAFANMKNLRSIDLSHVNEIDTFAFANCPNLSSIDLYRALYLGDSCFMGCTGLKEIRFELIPSSENKKYVTIHYSEDESEEWIEERGPKHMGKRVFQGCTSLENIKIVNSYDEIGEYAFQNCTNLKEVTINNVYYIGIGAFQDCNNLTTFTFLPSDDWYFSDIRDFAFKGTSSLKSFSFPQSTKYLGEGVFQETGLKRIDIPRTIIKIGNALFENSKIEEINYEGSYNEIPNNFAYECENLKVVTINSEIETINSGAFGHTKSLQEVRVSATYILNWAFIGSGLKTIYLSKDHSYIETGAFDDCKNLKNVFLSNNIEINIARQAFPDSSSINVIMGEGTKVVLEPYTFSDSDINGFFYDGDEESFKSSNAKIIVRRIEIDQNGPTGNTIDEIRPIDEEREQFYNERLYFVSTTKVSDGRHFHWVEKDGMKIPEIW